MKPVVDPNRVMVTRTFVRKVNGIEVESACAYIAVKEGGLWDEALIAWANRREAELRRKRA